MSVETDLVNALFAAASAPPRGSGTAPVDPWESFLDQLAEAAQAERAVLRVRWADQTEAGWRVGEQGGDFPAMRTVERMRSGRIYSQIDLPAAPAPAEPLRALRLMVGRDGIALIAVSRTARDFRALDGICLAGLDPYLGPALASWRRLADERARAGLDAGLCRDFGIGWILFTATGRVRVASEGLIERLQAEAAITLRPDGGLTFPPGEAEQAFRRAQARLAADPEARAELLLSAAPQLHMSLRNEEVAGRLRLVGRLRREVPARTRPLDRIRACFELSTSEARLAARICDGMSLRDASRDLGWTIETARSASKAIYARIGASGQSDVVRKMLHSTIWTD